MFRLFVWYSIGTVIFRCPASSSDLTDDSPRICKPYTVVRSYVAPYVEPSYNAYLKPYVVQAQPHIDRLNEQLYSPAAAFTKKNYDLYAAPRVGHAQQIVESEWSKVVSPKLEAGKQWAQGTYDEKLSPHVTKAFEASDPYVTKAQSELNEIYGTRL